MIVMKSNQSGVSEALAAHYQVIRRYCTVVPFEPSRIAEGSASSRVLHDFRQGIAVHAAYVQRRTGTDVQVGSGLGRGFFSAAKPNLRNAP
jgi:hypothetical protein